MGILFTRSTKPHQLDIKLFSDSEPTTLAPAPLLTEQPDTASDHPPYHPPVQNVHKKESKERYRQLLIDNS